MAMTELQRSRRQGRTEAAILEALALMHSESAGPILFRASDGVPVMVVTALTTPRRCHRSAAVLSSLRRTSEREVEAEVSPGITARICSYRG